MLIGYDPDSGFDIAWFGMCPFVATPVFVFVLVGENAPPPMNAGSFAHGSCALNEFPSHPGPPLAGPYPAGGTSYGFASVLIRSAPSLLLFLLFMKYQTAAIAHAVTIITPHVTPAMIGVLAFPPGFA